MNILFFSIPCNLMNLLLRDLSRDPNAFCFKFLKFPIELHVYKQNRINSMCLYQVIMTLYFLNDVANDAESTKTIITS